VFVGLSLNHLVLLLLHCKVALIALALLAKGGTVERGMISEELSAVPPLVTAGL
jgi:hypothetical protein